MISDTCNPASNYLLLRPSATVPHPAGARSQPVLAGGQRELQHDQQLDRCRLQRADCEREDEQTMTEQTQRIPRSAATVRAPSQRPSPFGAGLLRRRRQQPAGQPQHACRTRPSAATSGWRSPTSRTASFPVFLAQLPIRFANGIDRRQHLRGVGLPRQHQRHRWRFSCHRQRADRSTSPIRPTQRTSSGPATCTRTSIRRRVRWCSATRWDRASWPSRWSTACCTVAAWCSTNAQDANARLIQYWINNPSPRKPRRVQQRDLQHVHAGAIRTPAPATRNEPAPWPTGLCGAGSLRHSSPHALPS